MKSVMAGMMMLLLSSISYANDGKIIGKVLVLGTTVHSTSSGPTVVGQVLLDEQDSNWNDDADGDSSTFGDDCAVSLYFASNMIDLSTDGGKATYSALMSAQATGLLAIIDYLEDSAGNCFVQSVLTLPPGSF